MMGLHDLAATVSSSCDTLQEVGGRLIEVKDLLAAYARLRPETEPSFIAILTIFILAVFVGYYVVWRVTPALHSPLMAVTNALSSVIIVGALLSCGLTVEGSGTARLFGFFAALCAAVNIVGGFLITHRMLDMFKRSAAKKKT